MKSLLYTPFFTVIYKSLILKEITHTTTPSFFIIFSLGIVTKDVVVVVLL